MRVALVSSSRGVLAMDDSEDGLLSADNAFVDILTGKVGKWLDHNSELPVLMSGMVGSRTGWIEVPYAHCPIHPNSLANELLRVDEFTMGDCWIVPGVRGVSVNGEQDLMRGEEIQVIGAIECLKKNGQKMPELICLPGSHNKWVEVSKGVAVRFSTTMTGELFDVLGQHSILSQALSGGDGNDWETFKDGLNVSAGDGGLFHHLFSVRTRSLLADQNGCPAASFLSGILIGNELKEMLPGIQAPEKVCIVASPVLAESYSRAFGFFGIDSCSVDCVTATTTGHTLVGRAAGLLPPD